MSPSIHTSSLSNLMSPSIHTATHPPSQTSCLPQYTQPHTLPLKPHVSLNTHSHTPSLSNLTSPSIHRVFAVPFSSRKDSPSPTISHRQPFLLASVCSDPSGTSDFGRKQEKNKQFPLPGQSLSFFPFTRKQKADVDEHKQTWSPHRTAPDVSPRACVRRDLSAHQNGPRNTKQRVLTALSTIKRREKSVWYTDTPLTPGLQD
ncbi:hypothetical protein RRG08_008472 [Elysia crispata]|uniref:Uncharacterized protein n=1 Tax=Elysia crispata TaxID=231223 RepID=A0AAE0Z9Y3_9GAST|nr:hypothetical protein RRG08_008472 [Elysia crispata]